MNIEFNEKNETVIPDGYKWCDSCRALTPHKINDTNIECKACKHRNYSSMICPKCGKKNADVPTIRYFTDHKDGCHNETMVNEGRLLSRAEEVFMDFSDSYLKNSEDQNSHERIRQLKEYNNKTECRCPQYPIYQNINIISVDGGSSWSESGTDYWWRYKVRCAICGHVYEDEDST